MNISILTLFPEMFHNVFTSSLIGKAKEKKILDLQYINFRDFANNKHNRVDDTIYGGGQGMLLMPDPIVLALESVVKAESTDQEIILLSPQGKVFNQEEANRLAKKKNLIFICGHYEGFDERIRSFVDTEFTIGDYVLTGGEIPAMVIIDSIARLIPGVIQKEKSYTDDSFYNGLLEYPQYTKPQNFRGLVVPEVLLSGHHLNIEKWRKKESLKRTLVRRPTLLENYHLDDEETELLKEICKEENIEFNEV